MANNASSDKWYFTKEQLDGTPSRKCGYDSYKELSYRQQTANFIQDMGQRLKVSQLCINTAIVYMHRFYVFHSFTNFPWHQMAAAALFLAAKVEEQPRKLEYVIRVANMCRNNRDTNIDVNSERYIAQSQDLVFNENVLLQTLGFDVAIDHPHTHVVRCCHLVRASKDLAQSSYFLASNSLHLTTMCLQYKPTVVACFCIHLACKWSSWEIPLSTEKKEWFLYVDPTVTSELLQQLTAEFLSIFESCPSRLKEKIMSIGDTGLHNTTNTITNSPFDTDPKKVPSSDQKDAHPHRTHETKGGSEGDQHKHRSSRPHESSSSSQQQREREYREKKEREKLAQQHGLKSLPPGASKQPPSSSSHHHRPPVDPKLKQPHSRPPSGHPSARPAEPRDILREAARDSPFGIATKDYNLHSKSDSSSNLKDVNKQRDYLLKPNATADSNAYGYNGDKTRPLPNKVPMKHEQMRRHEVKPDPEQKRPSVPGHDRNSYLGKNMNSTSQKVKSPFSNQDVNTGAGALKSVLKPSGSQAVKHHHNGNTNSNNNISSSSHFNMQIKEEIIPVANNNKDDILLQQYNPHQQIKEEVPSPVIKKPSLFSPEKSPIDNKNIITVPTAASTNSNVSINRNSSPVVKNESLPPLSPLQSPINRRNRNYSTGSEPELRPVMKKIDQVEGFENLKRGDSTIGINKLHQVPDIITPISDKDKLETEPALTFSKEMKPPDIIPPLCSDINNISTSQPIVNGIETNPMLISSLLKEAPTIPHLPVVAKQIDNNQSSIATFTAASVATSLTAETKDKEHHHHKSKKKNKEKHKHKDKDKSREDKEKKKKHKDKDREKHKHREKHDIPPTSEPPPTTEPIKIKIQKDKIQPVVASNPLKIKISKDVIKTESANGGDLVPGLTVSAPPIALKIKIPREKISNCTSEVVEKSRKRERDRSVPSSEAPPGKMSRSGGSGHRDSKQNGRHSSYGKVTQLGDGDASIHRLAESKYINKSSTSS